MKSLSWKAAWFGAAVAVPIVGLVDLQALVFRSWWPVCWLALPVAGVVMLVVGAVRRKAGPAVVGLLPLSVGLLAAWLASFVSRSQVAENKLLGNQMVAALHAYCERHGSSPETLRELVPEFVPAVPKPSLGMFHVGEWWYFPSEGASRFTLGYSPMRGFLVTYVKGDWVAYPVSF